MKRDHPHPSACPAGCGPNSRGFTLVELLFVLVIISVLAGLVVPRLASRSTHARQVAAQADLDGNLATALELYELDMGSFPSEGEGLRALVEDPGGTAAADRWQGPYVRGGIPKDPWGHPYGYRNPSQRSGFDFDLISAGADGVLDTEDDLVNGGRSESPER